MIILIILVCIVVGGIILSQMKKEEQLQQETITNSNILMSANRWLALIKAHGGLLPIPSRTMLKKGEKAFLEENSKLFETRSVRNYQSGSVGVRVMRGVTVGQSRGTSSSSDEWNIIDEGTLTITNHRIIFNGGKSDRTILLDKLISVNFVGHEMVEVSCENRQKSMVFKVSNAYIACSIAKICHQYHTEGECPTKFTGEVDMKFS